MNKLYVTLMSCLILSSFSTLAKADRAGGGGDAPKSSRAQVKAILYRLPKDQFGTGLVNIFKTIQQEMNQKGEALHIADPQLREVFGAMLGDQAYLDKALSDLDAKMPPGSKFKEDPRNYILYSPIATELKNTKINIKEDGPCKDMDGKDQDASVAKYELGADICFSVERLRKIPPRNLFKSIMALLTHEVTHQFGFKDEKLANKVERFVYDHVYSDCKMSVYFNHTSESDNLIWKRFNIFPKKGFYALAGPAWGQRAEVTYEMEYTNIMAEVLLTSFNTDKDFDMEVYKNRPSHVRFSALNPDKTKTSLDIDFTLAYNPKEPSGWQSSKKDAAQIRGTFNGKPLPSLENVQVDSECFYGFGTSIYE